jgi:hypothetical protein
MRQVADALPRPGIPGPIGRRSGRPSATRPVGSWIIAADQFAFQRFA